MNSSVFLSRPRVNASPRLSFLTKRQFVPQVTPPTKKPAPCSPELTSSSTSTEVDYPYLPVSSLEDLCCSVEPENTTEYPNSNISTPQLNTYEEDEESEYEDEEPLIFTEKSKIPSDLGQLQLQQILALNEADFELIRHLVIPERIQEKEKPKKQLPAVTVDSDGNLVLKEDTLISNAPQPNFEAPKKMKTGACSKKERNLFYLGVRLFGKNPDKIATIIPDRSRVAVKNWLTTERKKNAAMLAQAETLEPHDIDSLLTDD
uniref:HTH myb-type domain-containing protein n=1 Tax=Vannella robusta TaxID=1487602 RepID=A0A6U1T9U8_9EUKA|mmetsp:Transcript_14138/g.17859  ORF Transcript_14138/g.17859 Transcript_14138/m.17859 type:complete len:261 (+) Transcript_14138:1607-2389(+)